MGHSLPASVQVAEKKPEQALGQTKREENLLPQTTGAEVPYGVLHTHLSSNSVLAVFREDPPISWANEPYKLRRTVSAPGF